jgi:hypothetical protein
VVAGQQQRRVVRRRLIPAARVMHACVTRVWGYGKKGAGRNDVMVKRFETSEPACLCHWLRAARVQHFAISAMILEMAYPAILIRLTATQGTQIWGGTQTPAPGPALWAAGQMCGALLPPRQPAPT